MKTPARTESKFQWFPIEPVVLNDARLWIAVAVVLLFSLVQRLYFYTGFYGSDEVTYVEAAVRAMNGDYSLTTYIGSLRYGFQLPIAGLMYLFGQTEAVANLWTLICSMAEITLVVVIGSQIIGFRAALLAGLLLGTLPLHVHYAGRMMADTPLAFFMTTTFLLFWLGLQRGRARYFFAAGLAAGVVLWIKESTVVFLVIFLTFPLVFRTWNWRWAWMLLGFSLMLGANLLFFNQVAADPFYAFRIAGGTVSRYSGGDVRFSSVFDSTLFYPHYLFVKLYHTWMVGYLALAGVFVWARVRYQRVPSTESAGYVIWWCFGMTILFSCLPVSLEPLKLITKQVNYMLMFMAPLALLGGLALARLRGRRLALALAVVVLPAAVLSAMERNVIEVFTANSKATVTLAKAHPGMVVHGASGARRAAIFDALVAPQGAHVRIASMSGAIEDVGLTGPAYVVFDSETAGWGYSRDWALDRVPGCWVSGGVLNAKPALVMPWVFEWFQAAARMMPSQVGDKLARRMESLTMQKPAYIFRVPDGGCSPV